MDNHSLLRKNLETELTAKWRGCPEQFSSYEKRFSYIEKRIWEFKFERFLKISKKELNANQSDKSNLLKNSKMFFKENLAYPQEQVNLIFSKEMLTASQEFIHKSWDFDSELGNVEIFQALRNLWIMLGLQAFFQKEVKITPSLLAYSLLYPYTDNLIDSTTISQEDKLKFSDRFEKRLSGKQVNAQSRTESRIFDLVAMIESEFDRSTHPELYKSLLDIHHAQTQSIKLLNSKSDLSDEERFQICIDKGATSVIADGFLVLGKLDEKQYRFLYDYGAYLQIIDDLQDARDDHNERIMTCFSSKLNHTKLDQLHCKTSSLGKYFYERLENLYPNNKSFKELIQKSFNLLLIASVFQNKTDFSQDFIKSIEKQIPFRFSFLKKKTIELKRLQIIINRKIKAHKAEYAES